MTQTVATPPDTAAPLPRRVGWPPTQRGLVFWAAVVALVVLAVVGREAIGPYIVAGVVVFLLDGLVRRMSDAGLPRWAGTLIALGAFIVVVVLLAVAIIELVATQLADLFADLPAMLASIDEWIASLGLPEQVQALLEDMAAMVVENLPELAAGLLSGIAAAFANVASAVAILASIPFWMYYTLADSPNLSLGLRRIIPVEYRDAVSGSLSLTADTFSRWAGSLFIEGLVVGTAFFIGFTILGAIFDPDLGTYALLFAFMLAISELVPIIGPVIMLVPILLVTLAIAGPAGVVVVTVMFVVIELIDGSILLPRIQGHALDLHAAVILPALAIGAAIAGLLGAILALPVVAAGSRITALLFARAGPPPPESVAVVRETDPGLPPPEVSEAGAPS